MIQIFSTGQDWYKKKYNEINSAVAQFGGTALFTPSFIGFSSQRAYKAQYKLDGKICHVSITYEVQ